jgi:hypothetical protein
VHLFVTTLSLPVLAGGLIHPPPVPPESSAVVMQRFLATNRSPRQAKEHSPGRRCGALLVGQEAKLSGGNWTAGAIGSFAQTIQVHGSQNACE